jgi:hypothetical protein
MVFMRLLDRELVEYTDEMTRRHERPFAEEDTAAGGKLLNFSSRTRSALGQKRS